MFRVLIGLLVTGTCFAAGAPYLVAAEAAKKDFKKSAAATKPTTTTPDFEIGATEPVVAGPAVELPQGFDPFAGRVS